VSNGCSIERLFDLYRIWTADAKHLGDLCERVFEFVPMKGANHPALTVGLKKQGGRPTQSSDTLEQMFECVSASP
jgi:hypothetical protein